MAKFLVLYRSSKSAAEQMAQGSAEVAAAWMSWAERAGDAIVDLGAPLNTVAGTDDSTALVGGFSILQAESAVAVVQVLEGHPHTDMGGTIQVLEFLSMPGM
jgi:spermidine/putrescine-binding protein